MNQRRSIDSASSRWIASGVSRRERVTHVVVPVRRLALSRRDRVDVDVEDLRRQEDEVRQARLLGALAERGRPRVALALVVSAHLEPCVEPAVVVQENPPRRGMHDEPAARDVSRRERLPRETAGLRLDEREDRREIARLPVVRRDVAEEGGPEGGAGGIEPVGRFHGRTLAGGAGSGIIRGMAPPFDRPMITVFCGARAGVSTAYADEAAAVGREIVRAGAGLVFGGGRVGLMGVLADAVLEEGGIAYGVIPAGLFAKRGRAPAASRVSRS